MSNRDGAPGASSSDGAGGAPGAPPTAPIAGAAVAAGAASPAGYGPPQEPLVADPFPGLRPPGVPAMPWFDAGQLPVATTPPRAASLPPRSRAATGVVLPRKRGTPADLPVSAGSVPPSTPPRAPAPTAVFIGTESPLGTEVKDGKEAEIKGNQEVKGSKEDEGNLLARLAEAMTGINQSIALLSQRLDQVDKEPQTYPQKNLPKEQTDVEKNSEKNFEPLKDIHFKDIDKPSKFDGQHLQIWSQNSTNFLERRDRRWTKLLK